MGIRCPTVARLSLLSRKTKANVTLQVGNYTPAGSHCFGRAGVSAKNFMAFELAALPGSRNLGIYNCAVIPGSSQLSVHADGRALDAGTPHGVPTPASLLHVEQLRLFSHEVGIQGIIHNRKAWWSNYGPNWLTYSGDNPHLDHIHIEIQAKWRDTGITADWLNTCLFGPARYPYPPWDMVKQGDKGDSVHHVQQRLRAHGMTPPMDGVFGPATDVGVRAFQKAVRIEVDGIVGPITYGRLGQS